VCAGDVAAGVSGTAAVPAPSPEEIRLERAAAVLRLRYADGVELGLPCRVLRAFSPSADSGGLDAPDDKLAVAAEVNIERIEPVGHYAVKLIFSDGHDTGIYTWEYLRELGGRLAECEARLARVAGQRRSSPPAD